MTDCFALLGEPRRPWLDPEALKQKFLALSGESHPDRHHSAGTDARDAAHDNYVALNGAYQRLREPKDRLQHLLELERGSKPGDLKQVPSELMTLFMETAALCRDADQFLRQRRAVTSPLLRVELFEPGQGLVEKLQAAQSRLRDWTARQTEQLKALGARWVLSETPSPPMLGELEQLYHLFGFGARWAAQLQERIVQISLE